MPSCHLGTSVYFSLVSFLLNIGELGVGGIEFSPAVCGLENS